jgi:bifunctional non-homologous end joining protein LigD
VTLTRSVSKRPQGRVLIDALQNARGKPLASVYSVRPFPKAPVSVPVKPEDLRRKFRPEKWNLKTIFQRLKEDGDLWGDFWQKRQRLENATQLLSEQVSKPKTR